MSNASIRLMKKRIHYLTIHAFKGEPEKSAYEEGRKSAVRKKRQCNYDKKNLRLAWRHGRAFQLYAPKHKFMAWQVCHNGKYWWDMPEFDVWEQKISFFFFKRDLDKRFLSDEIKVIDGLKDGFYDSQEVG